MKKLFNDPRWEPILMLLGNIAVFDWLIFPGLTVASTFINMLTIIGFIAVFLFDLNYVKEKYFTKSEEEKSLEAKWKADLEEKMKKVKIKSKIK
jgi:amino acid transporter